MPMTKNVNQRRLPTSVIAIIEGIYIATFQQAATPSYALIMSLSIIRGAPPTLTQYSSLGD